jgi:hypothetical protein
MQIDSKQQDSKHDSPICFNLDPESNVITCNFEWLKLDLHRISTELGMQIDFKRQDSKHDSSIRVNLDPESNVIDCSSELMKLDLHRISTELGMQIDFNEQNLKHDSSIRFNFDSNSNVIDPIAVGSCPMPSKQDLPIVLMSPQIEMSSFRPKYRISLHSTRSTRKSRSILIRSFPASTKIPTIKHPTNADASIQTTELGM